MKSMTEKRKQSSRRMAEVRPALEERSAGYCEVCAFPLHTTDKGYEAEHHHRKLRTRGGTDGPENAVLVHFQCHAGLHQNPAVATDNGHIVASWDDPATTPLIYQGRLALLGVDGTVTYLDGESDAA